MPRKKPILARDVKITGPGAISKEQSQENRSIEEKAKAAGQVGGDVLAARQESAKEASQAIQQNIQAQAVVESTQPTIAREAPTGVISSEGQKQFKAQAQGPFSASTISSAAAAASGEMLFKKIETNQDLTAEDTAMISQLQLNDLDIAQIKAGKAHISKFAEMIDSVPLLGRSKRVAGVSIGVNDFIAETPSSSINKLLDGMQASKTNIAVWTQEIQNNPQKASTYLPLIEQQEKEILTLESRIKLMSIQQTSVQANPEIYNNIQKEINDILTKTGSAKTELQLLGIR